MLAKRVDARHCGHGPARARAWVEAGESLSSVMTNPKKTEAQ